MAAVLPVQLVPPVLPGVSDTFDEAVGSSAASATSDTSALPVLLGVSDELNKAGGGAHPSAASSGGG